MRKGTWFIFSALLGALVLAGCQPKEEGTTSKADGTSVASSNPTTTAPADVKRGAETAKTTLSESKQEKPDTNGTQAKDTAAKDPEAEKRAVIEAEKAKTTQAKPTIEASKVSEQRLNPSNTQGTPSPQARPKPVIPADANKGAVATNFAGTWKRFIDPKLRGKYLKVEALQKKRGKKLFPIDNILTLKSDGTFVWDDNALITGRKIVGSWTVKNGVATLSVKTIDGKAPDKSDAKSFEAMVSKNGKVLYRGKNERGRYDKV